MKDTPWADGPAFVTQCPIAKGNSFLYDFFADNQAGTFWYHSHLCEFPLLTCSIELSLKRISSDPVL